jgi:hypothetical protein
VVLNHFPPHKVFFFIFRWTCLKKLPLDSVGRGEGVHARGNLTAGKGRKWTPWSTGGFAENSAATGPFNGAEPVFELPYWGGVEPQVDPLDCFDVTHLPHFPHSLSSIKFIYLYKNNKKIGVKGEVLGAYKIRWPHWHKVFFHFYLFQSKKIRCHHIVLGEGREEGLRLEPRKRTNVIAPIQCRQRS